MQSLLYTRPKLVFYDLVVERRKKTKTDVYKDDDLLDIVGDLCNFVMDHVVYYKGDYHNP